MEASFTLSGTELHNLGIVKSKVRASTASLVLADLFAKIWNLLGIPIDCSIRLIHKIPNKGALTIVTTVARHKHLSLFQLISSKVFCRTFLKMIDGAIDPKLRPEQTRFRKRPRLHGSRFSSPEHH